MHQSSVFCSFFFFFQAEDGIRDLIVTGVQTCALPISCGSRSPKRMMSPVWPGNCESRGGTRAARPEGWSLKAITPIISDRNSTRLNSSHDQISYAVFCLKKKKKKTENKHR